MPGDHHRTRRVTRACDRCHQTNNKCSQGPEPTVCQTCFEFRSACTYNRPVKRRGPKPPPATSGAGAAISRLSRFGDSPSPGAWSCLAITEPDTIVELVELYHSIVYPIFPFFHWPSFIAQVRGRLYNSDQATYVTVMTVCAIVAARQTNDRASNSTASPMSPIPPSRAFYEAAVAAFPLNLTRAQGFEFKRAKVLMAIACIQYGEILAHQTHLGEYVVLACNDGFQDESRWERDLTEIQLQERRRLFWSAYTLEVFSALTWDGVVRFRERQCNVDYPAEVYDDDITDFGVTVREPSFLQGWNAVTDMYRILEHLVGRQKTRNRSPSAVSAMFTTPGPSSSDIMDYLNAKYMALPAVYRSTQAMIGNAKQDRFGFQAANLTITLQTVKLALAGAENHSVGRSCEIAGELLDALAAIPTAYITAISTPMLHHLASCGHLLANVIQRPLSQWALMQVRNVLTAMIDLLSGLERTLSLASDVSVKLRGHVALIETYMDQAASTAQQNHVYHRVVPRFSTYANTIPSTEVTASCLDQALTQSVVPGDTLNHDDQIDQLGLWANEVPFEWPSDHQIEFQTDLTQNWPFDIGGGLYELFGEGQSDMQDRNNDA